MKENFPLLNLIKTIFLSLWGYSFNEARSVSTPSHAPAACMVHSTLSKRLAQRSACFGWKEVSLKAQGTCHRAQLATFKLNVRAFRETMSTCWWLATHSLSFINVLFFFREFIDQKGQLPIFRFNDKRNQSYSEEAQAELFWLNSDFPVSKQSNFTETSGWEGFQGKITIGLNQSFRTLGLHSKQCWALCDETPGRGRFLPVTEKSAGKDAGKLTWK